MNQFGCGKLKRIVAIDMSPCMRNTVSEGGIGQGKWTDEDFMQDLDRIFDDVGNANWHIMKNHKHTETSAKAIFSDLKILMEAKKWRGVSKIPLLFQYST